MTLSEESNLTEEAREKHRAEVREVYVHSPVCRVHEPHLSLCSCGLETRIKDALVEDRVRYSFLWGRICRLAGTTHEPLNTLAVFKDGAERFRAIQRALSS